MKKKNVCFCIDTKFLQNHGFHQFAPTPSACQDEGLAAALGVDQFEEPDDKCPWSLGLVSTGVSKNGWFISWKIPI